MIVFYEAEKPGVAPLRVWRAVPVLDSLGANVPPPYEVFRHGEWVSDKKPADVLQSREVGDDFAHVVRWAVLPNGNVVSLLSFWWDHRKHYWLHRQDLGVGRFGMLEAADKAFNGALPPDAVTAPTGMPLNEESLRRILGNREAAKKQVEETLAKERAAREEHQRGAKLARLRELSERTLESLTATEYAERMKLKRELRGQL